MSRHLVPATFSCSPVGRRLGVHLGPYAGYTRPEEPERPLFTREAALRLVADWNALPEPRPHAPGSARYEAHYNSNDRTFHFFDAAHDAWHVWEGETVGVATLYPIGAGAWKWECHS